MLVYLLLVSLASCSFSRFGRQRPASGGVKMPEKFVNAGRELNSFGVMVGTSRNARDVISEDAVVETYMKDSPGITTIRAGVNVVGFFISRSKPNRVMIQRPQIYTTGKGVSAKLTQWDGRPMKEAPLDSDPTETLGFSIQFTCHAVASSEITVIFRAFQTATTDASNAPRLGENVKDLSFTFIKNCSKTTATEQSDALLGLNILLLPLGEEVMRDGIPTKLFTVKSSKLYEVVNTTKLVFGVSAPTGVVFSKYAVVHDLTVTSVDIFGDTDFSQPEGGGQAKPHILALGFTCRKAGNTLVTVFLSPSNATTPAQFAFRKYCAGATTSRTIGVREEGLYIHSSDGIAMVKNGLVQSAYKPAMRRSDDSEIDRPLIPADQAEMVFIVTVPAFPKTSLRYPWVSATPYTGQHPIVRPKIKMDRKAWNGISTSLNATFRVQFGCFDVGVSNVVVTILVEDQGEIEFVLRKECDKQTDATDLDPVASIEGLRIGLTPGGAEVAEDGVMKDSFKWQKQSDNLENLHLVPVSSPFISFYLSGSLNLMFGPPQISFGENLAEVEISGSGAQGGYIDMKHTQATVSVSFHCIAEGTAIFNLILPLTEYVDPAAQDYDYDYMFSRGGRRLLEETGGGTDDFEEKAIMITFQKECAVDPKNTRVGLGGLYEPGLMVCFTKDCLPSDTAVVVKNGFPTAKFYGQRGLPEEQRYWDIIPNTTSSTQLYVYLDSQDAKTTRTLDIGTPLVIRDNKVCSPELSGSLKVGGRLQKRRDVRELGITYNCEYEGLAVMSVILPIIPRGTISISLAKQCSGPSEPAGVLVTGLNIGLTKKGHEVVEDGLTTPKFNKFVPITEEAFLTEKKETIFYISRTGSEPLKALEPIVFSHRHWIGVQLTHELHIEEAEDEDDDDMIVIENKIRTLNITYNCFAARSAPITLTIPLLPEGTVQFTWVKSCESLVDSFSGLDDPYDYGGDFYGYDANELAFLTNADVGRAGDLGYINVGTTPGGTEVVDKGRTTDRYTMDGDSNDPYQMKTIINKQTDKAAFFLSVPEDSEEFGTPIVRVLNNAHGTVVCRPTITGPAVQGGTLEPNKPVLLVVEFNCIEGATGVSPILVSIPLPNDAKAISFRIIKICGVFEISTAMAWTPARVLWLALGIIVALLSICGICWWRCRSRAIKYTKVGDRAQLPSAIPDETLDDSD